MQIKYTPASPIPARENLAHDYPANTSASPNGLTTLYESVCELSASRVVSVPGDFVTFRVMRAYIARIIVVCRVDRKRPLIHIFLHECNSSW